MHSLFFVIVSASIAVAQNPFRDSTEATDNPGPGVETFSPENNDPDPTFSLDALNLLGAPKVLTPETDNDRIYNAYLPNLLAYKPKILHDFSDTPVAPESDENGRLPISDALNSGIPEASRIVEPDLSPSRPPQSDNLDLESNNGLVPNDIDNLISLSVDCDGQTSLDKRDDSFCPTNNYPSVRAELKDDLLKKDSEWRQRWMDAGKRPLPTKEDNDKCGKLKKLFNTNFIPMCCFGPGHPFERWVTGGQSYELYDMENCQYSWAYRPICVRGVSDKFCCRRVGAAMREQRVGYTSLFWGKSCIHMS